MKRTTPLSPREGIAIHFSDAETFAHATDTQRIAEHSANQVAVPRGAALIAGLVVALAAFPPASVLGDVPAVSQDAPGPSFVSYDAEEGLIFGASAADSHVVLLDDHDQVVSQTTAGSDGGFALPFPQSSPLGEGWRVVSYGDDWSMIGEPLPASTFALAVADARVAQARRELALVLEAIAERPSLGVTGAVSADDGAAPAEPQGMPVLPYFLGAASALLAMGAAAGVGAAALHVRRPDVRSEPFSAEGSSGSEPTGVLPATPSSLQGTEPLEPVAAAPRNEGLSKIVPVESPSPAPVSRLAHGDGPTALSDGLDELERFALSFVADASTDRRPMGAHSAETLPADPRSGLLPGDSRDGAGPAGPSSAAEPDWLTLALEELALSAGDRSGAMNQPTADFSLMDTGSVGRIEASRPSRCYVAPVVGPRAVREHGLEGDRGPARPLVADDPSSTTVWVAASKRGRSPHRGESGVPLIAKGGGPHTVVPEIGTQELVVVQTPSPYGAAAASTAVEYGAPAPAARFGSDYAARPASNVYSADGAVDAVDGAPKVFSQASRSLAAAYAAAVYSSVPEEKGHASPTLGIDASTESGRTEAMRSLDESGLVYNAFSAVPLPAEYIDFMVQEEFEHRHDSVALRNAALSNIHVVNGSAASPVPLDAGLKNLRHRA